MSQAALAARIGVRAQSINYLCNPSRNPKSSRHTYAIARVLGVSPEWLATGVGSPPSEPPCPGRPVPAPHRLPALPPNRQRPPGAGSRAHPRGPLIRLLRPVQARSVATSSGTSRCGRRRLP
ncbi:helix-turn-helix transcriptional regulator [Cupriavidus gilardii]|uniref:helix-turn-helix transcriptional regulator n=1 Tax=Cupriavidus gilardii TaxID=82541 RepID=UPI003B8A9436